MYRLVVSMFGWAGAFLRSRQDLALEILALRQQVLILKGKNPRPTLGRFDRLFWVALRRIWSRWTEVLVVVKPETVVSWHRAGFRLYWRFISRRADRGRPRINHQVRKLIQRMAAENPTWGAPRIHGVAMETWLGGFGADRLAVPGSSWASGGCGEALADLPEESSRSDCGDGLLYSPHGHFPYSVLLLCDWP